MGLFDWLFRQKEQPAVRNEDTFGPHRIGLSVSRGRFVYFLDEQRGIRRLIIDEQGRFCGFPGVVREKCWTRSFGRQQLAPCSRYETSIQLRPDGRWLVLWEIQPDGMYWSDGGFGVEDDEEIYLYAYLDGTGRFTGPFRVYSVGDKQYFQEGS